VVESHFQFSTHSVNQVLRCSSTSRLREQPTFREDATSALAKQGLSNKCRNSILTTCTTRILVVLLIGCAAKEFPLTKQKHYQDLGSAHHQYGISGLATQKWFCEGSSGNLPKRRLFSQATVQGTFTSCIMARTFPRRTV